jgi:uncharacterized protein (DUF427 family)
MGLMTGSGPFGREPAGTFNFEPPSPGQALYIEPSPKRIRVEVGGETVADSRGVVMVHESGHQPVYYFPPQDVRADLLEPSERHTRCSKKGDASYQTIRAGSEVVEAGAWYYPEPLPGATALKGMIAFYWNRMGAWFEEGEQVFVHPRDPYHRVDVRRSDSDVKVSLDGQLLARSTRAQALFESNLPTRWYIPREDVVAALAPSETVTACPYKGTAGYHSVELAGGEVANDLVWFYDAPFDEAGPIAGLLCFFNERVDIELDGVPQERPQSPWSHGVKSQNLPPVETRG